MNEMFINVELSRSMLFYSFSSRCIIISSQSKGRYLLLRSCILHERNTGMNFMNIVKAESSEVKAPPKAHLKLIRYSTHKYSLLHEK